MASVRRFGGAVAGSAALATAGVAGPGGGTEAKPVGTAYVAVAYAGPWETETSGAIAERRTFEGDRGATRERIARAALELLHGHVDEDP